MSTKVILKEDLEHLGGAGDVVTVKPGYARNYLIPQGLALRADERNVRKLEHAKRIVERHRKKVLAEGESLQQRLEGVRIVLQRLAGEEGKLFGSVTTADIASALESKGVVVDRRSIQLDEAIRQLGDHDVVVRIKSVGEAVVKVSVEPEEDR